MITPLPHPRLKPSSMAAGGAHWPNGFNSIRLLSVTEQGARFGQPGYETDLLHLAALDALLLQRVRRGARDAARP